MKETITLTKEELQKIIDDSKKEYQRKIIEAVTPFMKGGETEKYDWVEVVNWIYYCIRNAW